MNSSNISDIKIGEKTIGTNKRKNTNNADQLKSSFFMES
jgi:hypothetical protein